MMDILVAILELGNLKCALAHCASPRSAHTMATWHTRPRPAHVCGDAHNHVVLLVAARYSDADSCAILGECDGTVADIANLLQIDGEQFKIEMVQDVVQVRAPAARRHAMSRSDTCNLEHMRQWFGRVNADAKHHYHDAACLPRQVAGEPMAKKLNKTKAMQARDSICRTVFNNIFLDIVLRCNLARQSASWSLRRPLLTP